MVLAPLAQAACEHGGPFQAAETGEGVLVRADSKGVIRVVGVTPELD